MQPLAYSPKDTALALGTTEDKDAGPSFYYFNSWFIESRMKELAG
jgi:hypothetical protein